MKLNLLLLLIFYSTVIYASLELEMFSGSMGNSESEVAQSSSFKACHSIALSTLGSQGVCVQRFANSFSDFKSLGSVKTLFDFQSELKKRVDANLSYKLFQADLLIACLKNDASWFTKNSLNFAENRSKLCDEKISKIQKSISEEYGPMRIGLALSSPSVKDDRLLADSNTWLSKKIRHDFAEFVSMPVIAGEEEKLAKEKYAEEVATLLLKEKNKKDYEFSSITNGSIRVSKIINDGKSKGLSEQTALENYILNSSNFSVSFPQHKRDVIHQKYKKKYYQALNRQPLLGFVTSGNPSNNELANAIAKTRESISGYYNRLQNSGSKSSKKGYDIYDGLNWKEYGGFTEEIEAILRDNPNYCGVAETVLNEKKKRERDETRNSLIAGVSAAAVCLFPGSWIPCLASGAALGVKDVFETEMAYQDLFGKNLSSDEMKNFESVKSAQNAALFAKAVLPLSIYAGGASTKISKTQTTHISGKIDNVTDTSRSVLKSSEAKPSRHMSNLNELAHDSYTYGEKSTNLAARLFNEGDGLAFAKKPIAVWSKSETNAYDQAFLATYERMKELGLKGKKVDKDGRAVIELEECISESCMKSSFGRVLSNLKNKRNTSIIVDPSLAQADSALGAFHLNGINTSKGLREDNLISISAEFLIGPKNAPPKIPVTLLHEIKHQAITDRLMKGTASPYHAEFRAYEGKELFETKTGYDSFMSMQELATHQQDLNILNSYKKKWFDSRSQDFVGGTTRSGERVNKQRIFGEVAGNDIIELVPSKAKRLLKLSEGTSTEVSKVLLKMESKDSPFIQFYVNAKTGNLQASLPISNGTLDVWLPQAKAPLRSQFKTDIEHADALKRFKSEITGKQKEYEKLLKESLINMRETADIHAIRAKEALGIIKPENLSQEIQKVKNSIRPETARANDSADLDFTIQTEDVNVLDFTSQN